MSRSLNSRLVLFIVLVVPWFLAGCGVAANGPAKLEFLAPMSVDSAQRFQVSLGVRNVGERPFTGYDAFNGAMELVTAGGDHVAALTVATLWRLAPGETGWPGAFESRLAPGAYQLRWGAGAVGMVMVDFTIVELDGWLYLGEEHVRGMAREGSDDQREYGALQSLVDLARVNLAQRLGAHPDAVTVVDIDQVEFDDTSLGALEEGRAYAQVVTPGYVIRLEAGGIEYKYHASAERLVFVPGGTPIVMPEGTLEIEGVEVATGEYVRVYGSATLPEDACIETKMSTSTGLLTWWPYLECAGRDGDRWELVVPLGEGGAPEELDPSVEYLVHANQSGGSPNDTSLFVFDLSGPPTPANP